MKKIALITLVLFLPVFFYIILVKLGENRFFFPPFYGSKTVRDTTIYGQKKTDTIYYQVKVNIEGIDINTDSIISTSKFKEDIVIYHFINSDDSIYLNRSCTMMKEWVQNRLNEYNDIKYITIASKPNKDSKNYIKNLYNRINPDPKFWTFLYTDSASVSHFSKALLLDFNKKEDFNKVVLVDKDQSIRAMYTGDDVNSVKKLLPDDARAVKGYYNLELKKNNKHK